MKKESIMAKKIVITEDEDDEDEKKAKKKEKKKRHKCCTCCLIILCVFIVIFGAAFGVGWYFGDKYSKQYLDMPLSDVFGVVSDLYWTKDKDVVTNPYGSDDLNGFYSELKENILLKADADVDFDELIEETVKSMTKTDSQGRLVVVKRNDSEENTGSGESGEDDESSSEIIDLLVDVVSKAFTAENIDKEKLAAYSEDNDEYIFELNDKQLAAFVNHIFNVVIENGIIDIGSMDGMSMLENVDITKALSIKQIKFRKQSYKDELGQEYAAVVADITVWVGLQDTAGGVLKSAMKEIGAEWAGGIAQFFGNVLLPKNLYATMSIPLEDNAKMDIRINDMSEVKSSNMKKLINGVFANLMGEPDTTVDSMLGKVTESFTPMLSAATKDMSFDNVEGKGVIEMDLIGSMAEMMNETDSEDPLSKADFMYLLQAMLTSSSDNQIKALEPYLYKEWYTNGENTIYKFDSSVNTDGYTKIDYSQKLVQELKSVYSLNIDDDATLSDILDLFGVSIGGENKNEGGSEGGSSTDEILDMLDKTSFKASLKTPSRKLKITDRMLASMLDGELDDLIGGGENSVLDGLELQLEALSFVSNTEKPDHQYALLAMSIDISSLIEGVSDGGALMAMAANILPDKLLFTITVDITQSLGEGETYDDVTFILNDYQKTDRIMSVLTKFVPDMDISSITNEVEKTLRDMVQQLDEMIGVDLVSSTIADGNVVTFGGMELPDIFTVITNVAFDKDENGNSVLTGDELRSVLNELIDTDGFSTVSTATSVDGFVDDVVDKYYINDDGSIANAEDKFTALTDYLDGTLDSSKFRVTGEDSTVKYLAYDTRTVEQLKPVMTGPQLAGLIKNNMTSGEGGGTDVTMYEVISVETSTDKLTVTLKINVEDLLPDDVQKLLDINSIFVTAEIDTSEAIDTDGDDIKDAYAVDVKINHMSQGSTEYKNLLKIIDNLGADFEIDEQTSEFGKILYEQINNLSESLGGEDFISFTDDGLEIAGFYDYLGNKLLGEDSDSATVKKAIQGMYEKPTVAGLDGNTNNYNLATLIINAPTNDDVLSNSDYVPMSGKSYTDRQFNGYISTILTAAGNVSVETIQTIALSKSDSSANASAVRAWVNSRVDGTPVGITDDYLVVTMQMSIDDFATDGASDENGASGFVPHVIYATVVLKLDATNGQFTSVGTIFNDMDAEAYALLLELMGMSTESTDESKTNITTITNDCLNGLNTITSLVNISITQSSSTGIGQVSFVSK